MRRYRVIPTFSSYANKNKHSIQDVPENWTFHLIKFSFKGTSYYSIMSINSTNTSFFHLLWHHTAQPYSATFNILLFFVLFLSVFTCFCSVSFVAFFLCSVVSNFTSCQLWILFFVNTNKRNSLGGCSVAS